MYIKFMQKDIPLTGGKLKELVEEMNERPNIIFGDSINDNSTIEDIFKNSGHAIIYHDWKDGSGVGHWICAVRQHNKQNNKQNNKFGKDGSFYFYDSFGKSPDTYNPSIKKVVSKYYDKLNYNDIVFQAKDANTCGRHCIMVCALNKMGFGPQEIDKFLKRLKSNKVNIDNLLIKNIY